MGESRPDLNTLLQVGAQARPYTEADKGFFGLCPETWYMNPNEKVAGAIEWDDEVEGFGFRFQRLIPIRNGDLAIFTISLGPAAIYPAAPPASIIMGTHTFRGRGILLDAPFEELVDQLERVREGEVSDDNAPQPRSMLEASIDLIEQKEIEDLYRRGVSVSGPHYRKERAS